MRPSHYLIATESGKHLAVTRSRSFAQLLLATVYRHAFAFVVPLFDLSEGRP